MSLPAFTTQAELFSTAGLSGCLFGPTDRYRLFALKIYPVLAQARSQLQGCYCADNGRVALEPVLLLGVSLFTRAASSTSGREKQILISSFSRTRPPACPAR